VFQDLADLIEAVRQVMNIAEFDTSLVSVGFMPQEIMPVFSVYRLSTHVMMLGDS